MNRAALIVMSALLMLAAGCGSDENNSENLPGPEASASQLVVVSFYSSSLAEEREITVYLPAGYDDVENEELQYPLVLFLHGANVTPAFYASTVKSSADALIESGEAQKMIIAMPNSLGGPFNNPFYTNSVLNGNYEDYIVEDVVSYMDENYRTLRTKENRAIMGHSMGAYGAMRIALLHPDVFSAVAAHSGFLDFALAPSITGYVLLENGGPGDYTPTSSHPITSLTYAMASAFSPNLEVEPYYVDFPVTAEGTSDSAVFAMWDGHDPAKMLSGLTASEVPAIYFDCGLQDQYALYPFSASFADSCEALGIEHTFITYQGDHFSGLPTQIPLALAFFDSVRAVD